MKLYIIRHGETEWNVAGKMQGTQDSRLTEKGKANALQLGEVLKDVHFDMVYCSPLGRAKETAQLVLKDKSVKTVFLEPLKEMHFGKWEGMKHQDIEAENPIQQYNFWNRPHLYQSVDGESYEDLMKRVRKALDTIIKIPCENVLVVTHTAVIKAFYAIVKGHSIEHFWNPPYLHDTCLNIIEIKDNEMKFILEGDVTHVKKDKKAI